MTDPGWTFEKCVRLVMFALIPVAVAVIGKRLLGNVEKKVLLHPEFQAADDELLVSAPEFMDEGFFRRVILDQNDLPDRFSAADAGVLRRLYESYRINPWVRTVPTKVGDRIVQRPALKVRREAPNRVVVELEYRRPAALVKLGEAHYLLDEDGILLCDGWEDGDFAPERGGLAVGPKRTAGRWLPLVMDPEQVRAVTLNRVGQEGPVLPLIEGAVGPVPAPGSAWKEPAVESAIAMWNWLADKPFAGQIRSVQVHREELRTFETWAVHLITPAGTVIDWGRPPGQERLLEPPAEKKLERLAQVALEMGGLDGKFQSLSLRPGRREAGVRDVQWVFAPVEKAPEPQAIRPETTTTGGRSGRRPR